MNPTCHENEHLWLVELVDLKILPTSSQDAWPVHHRSGSLPCSIVLFGYEEIALHHVQLIAKYLQHFNQSNSSAGEILQLYSAATSNITATEMKHNPHFTCTWSPTPTVLLIVTVFWYFRQNTVELHSFWILALESQYTELLHSGFH